jgi:hypothetical protein
MCHVEIVIVVPKHENQLSSLGAARDWFPKSSDGGIGARYWPTRFHMTRSLTINVAYKQHDDVDEYRPSVLPEFQCSQVSETPVSTILRFHGHGIMAIYEYQFRSKPNHRNRNEGPPRCRRRWY